MDADQADGLWAKPTLTSIALQIVAEWERIEMPTVTPPAPVVDAIRLTHRAPSFRRDARDGACRHCGRKGYLEGGSSGGGGIFDKITGGEGRHIDECPTCGGTGKRR